MANKKKLVMSIIQWKGGITTRRRIFCVVCNPPCAGHGCDRFIINDDHTHPALARAA